LTQNPVVFVFSVSALRTTVPTLEALNVCTSQQKNIDLEEKPTIAGNVAVALIVYFRALIVLFL
jgi:hypothetical protein